VWTIRFVYNTCIPCSALVYCCKRVARKTLKGAAGSASISAVDHPPDMARRISDCGPNPRNFHNYQAPAFLRRWLEPGNVILLIYCRVISEYKRI